MAETLLNKLHQYKSLNSADYLPQDNKELLCQLEAETQSLSESDHEGIPVSDSECIRRASEFLRTLYPLAEKDKELWASLNVNTAMDSGVEFYRFGSAGETSLTFRPNETRIDLQLKYKGQPTIRRWITNQEAASIALEMLRAV